MIEKGKRLWHWTENPIAHEAIDRIIAWDDSEDREKHCWNQRRSILQQRRCCSSQKSHGNKNKEKCIEVEAMQPIESTKEH